MHGLQSSLNRLNDVINEALKSEDQTAPQDAATIELTQAVKLLEERDDGLSGGAA
jgi:ArsR family metal-binding transcriptional regulator